MTKKDFEVIAATLKTFGATADEHEQSALHALALDFADRLRSTNKQFNRARVWSVPRFALICTTSLHKPPHVTQRKLTP